MAVTLTNNAEGGTNGTTVSVSNSGGASGDAWTSVSTGGGATALASYDNTHVAHGSLAYSFYNGTSGSQTSVTWNSTKTGGTATTFWVRFYLYMTAYPPTSLAIFRAQNTSSQASYRLDIAANGQITQRNASSNAISTSTNPLPLNQVVRIEIEITMGSLTGACTLTYYSSPDSTTADETLSASGANLGSGTLGNVIFGCPVAGSANAGTTLWMDDIGYSDVAALGPVGGGATTTYDQSATATSTASVMLVRGMGRTLILSTSTAPTLARVASLARRLTASTTAGVGATKGMTKALSATGSGTTSAKRSVGKPLALTSTGTPTLKRVVGKPFAVATAGSTAVQRGVSKAFAASTAAVATFSHGAGLIVREFAATVTGTARTFVQISDTILDRISGGASTVKRVIFNLFDD